MPLFDAMLQQANQQNADGARAMEAGQTFAGKSLDQWKQLLMGKTLDSKPAAPDSVTTFSKDKLPENARVLLPNTMRTMEFRPDRLNVHVDEHDVVHDVTSG